MPRVPNSSGDEEDPKSIPSNKADPSDVWATMGPRPRGKGPAGSTPGGSGSPEDPGPFSTLPATFGRYRVLRRLGKGGMGSVFLARDTQLDRLVALKIPLFWSKDDAIARERFLREARSAATLNHPNLVPVFDAGEIDGTPYLTMAFLEGTQLDELIAESREALPERQVAALVRKLALAMADAHAKKVIHRDLKPANIMINSRSEPVIMDFGLARRGGKGARRLANQGSLPNLGNDLKLTQPGSILGTPAYLAPEQAQGDGEDVGPACDVYSLGVILYELLTKQLPFQAPDVFSLLVKVVTEQPRSPFAYRPSLDPRLEAICMKALAKKPEKRFRSMSEFAEVLTEYLVATGPGGSSATIEKPPKEQPKPSKPTTKNRRRRNRKDLSTTAWVGIVLGSLIAAVLIGSGVLFALLPAPSGEVVIELSEPDAVLDVTLNGNKLDADSLKAPISLQVGQHELSASSEKFLPVSQSFTVKKGERQTVHVQLIPRIRQVAKAPSRTILPAQFDNALGMTMIRIPSTKETYPHKGTFTMGSPRNEPGHEPQEELEHEVEISEFYLGKHEVTQKQFRAVMGYNPSYFGRKAQGKSGVNYREPPGGGVKQLPLGESTDDYPVDNVSWGEAVKFCRLLNDLKDATKPTNWAYRLPREAEWEYACRGGSPVYSVFHFGNVLNDTRTQANFHGNFPYRSNKRSPRLLHTSKVGTFPANGFGLHDVHGNVWEWCADWYKENYYADSPKTDPTGPPTGTWRIHRGGCSASGGQYCRSAHRGRVPGSTRNSGTGFRVALVPSDRSQMD